MKCLLGEGAVALPADGKIKVVLSNSSNPIDYQVCSIVTAGSGGSGSKSAKVKETLIAKILRIIGFGVRSATENNDTIEAVLEEVYTSYGLPKKVEDALIKFGINKEEIEKVFREDVVETGIKSMLDDYINKNNIELSPNDVYALFMYTTGAIYQKLNYFLRQGINIEKTEAIVMLVRSALQKMPTSDKVHYRGVTPPKEPHEMQAFIDAHQKDKIVEYREFISASMEESDSFFGAADIKIIIKPKKAYVLDEVSASALSLKKDGLGDYTESLFDLNTKFKVKSYEEKMITRGNTTYKAYLISLEEI